MKRKVRKEEKGERHLELLKPKTFVKFLINPKFSPCYSGQGEILNSKDVSTDFNSHFRMTLVAFTLAEVLITLGIIGVVAALTLPSLISNKQSKELQSGLNAGYSIIQQGLNRMSVDKGYTVKTVNGLYPNEDGRFVTDYKRYFSKIYDCDKMINKPDPKICISRNDDMGVGSTDNSYRNFSKSSIVATGLLDDGQFILSGRMLVIIEQFSGAGLFISVEVNGKNRKPNIWGRDLFTFQLMNDGKLLPMGADGTSYSETDYCSKTLTGANNGIGCT